MTRTNWYASKTSNPRHVPTWNYEVVHAHGFLTFSHVQKHKRVVVEKLTRHFEHLYSAGKVWKVSDAPEQYMQHMLRSIVACKLDIQHLEAKCKLSQNRQAEDYASVRKKMLAINKPSLATAMQPLPNN